MVGFLVRHLLVAQQFRSLSYYRSAVAVAFFPLELDSLTYRFGYVYLDLKIRRSGRQSVAGI